MAKSVLAMPLPPAGMTMSYAAAKSKPAASGEPRTGIVACSVNFLINKTSSWAMVDIVRNSRKIFEVKGRTAMKVQEMEGFLSHDIKTRVLIQNESPTVFCPLILYPL